MSDVELAEHSVLWVHGTSGWLQSDTGFSIERFGYFLRVKADSDAEIWVHYSIPRLSGMGRRLADVLIELRTWGRAEIAEIHVWNGSTRLIGERCSLASPTGAQRREGVVAEPLQVLRTGLNSPHPITSALGVSMLMVARQSRDAVAIAAVGLEIAGS